MKAIKGYTKADYKTGPVVLEFQTIDAAAEYIARAYNQSVEQARQNIMNETNCDAVCFEDGSVILNELHER